MKKVMVWLLALCMMMTACGAMAEDDVVAQLRQIVQDELDSLGCSYFYDEEYETFDLTFEMDNDMESVDASIFLYDDMLSVSVYCPTQATEENYDALAVYLTLVNSNLYYSQFRMSPDSGWIICRSSNVIENVLPTGAEVDTLLFQPLFAVSDYGQGILEVMNGADPHEAFEACEQALNNGGTF